MATIPTYGPRRVRTAALTGGQRQTAETDLSTGAGLERTRAAAALEKGAASQQVGHAYAGLGDTIGQATDRIAAIVLAERRAADEVQALANENQLQAWVNKRLYDPETGALAVKGKDAMPLPETVAKDFDDFAGQLELALPNDRQKAAFQSQRANVALNLDGTVRRHVAQQMEQYDATETQSAIENNIQAAITNANDPRMIGVSLEKAIRAAESFGQRNGVGPERTAQQVAGIQEKTHVGVISSLLTQDNTKAAQVYFEEAKASGQLSGEALDRVEKALQVGKAKKTAQTKADEILMAGGSLTQQREKARQIEDPDVRQMVMQQLEHEDAVREKRERDADEDRLTRAYALVEKTGSVASIAPSDLAQLGNHLPGLYSFAQAKARGIPVETDLPTYYELMTKAGEDPEAFVATNLLGYRGKLGETEFKQLSSLQLSLRAGDKPKAEKELTSFRTSGQVIEDSLTKFGLDPNTKDQKQKVAISRLRQMVDVRVQTLQATTGKQARSEDIQSIVDSLLSQSTKTPGSWWNIFPGGKPFYDTEKRLIDATIADVPADDRRQIESTLRSHGRPVTDATILDLYLETQARKAR